MVVLGQQEIFDSLMTSFGYKLVSIKKEWYTEDKNKGMDFCASDCKIKTCTRNLNNKFLEIYRRKKNILDFLFKIFLRTVIATRSNRWKF